MSVTVLVLLAAALWPAVELGRQWLASRALRAARRTVTPDVSDRQRFAGVDVLQAIRSGDPTLADSLAQTLLALAPHGARLHWLIDEDDAAARTTVDTVLAAHPALRTQVRPSLHPPCPPAINPKLFKLDRALPGLEGDTVMVLDDDARLPASTLDALLAVLRDERPERGVIVTALPAYLPADNLGSRLLAAFVDDHAALTYLPSRLRDDAPTLNGMAWAIRRDTLDAIGGFAPRLSHLTDDLAMAQARGAGGGRNAPPHEPVWMRTELPDLRAYLRQMHRWMLFARLLLDTQPRAARRRIVLGQGLPTVLPHLALIALCLMPSPMLATLFASGAVAHVLGRHALQRGCTGADVPLHPFASLAAALLQPLHLVRAWLDPRIHWRNRRYRVYANDRFEASP